MYQCSNGQQKRLIFDFQPTVFHVSWIEYSRQWTRKADLPVGHASKSLRAMSSYAHRHMFKYIACAYKSSVYQVIPLWRKKITWLVFAMLSPFTAYALGMGGVDLGSVWTYSGWTCDPTNPGYQNEVQAKRDDGEFLGRIIAGNPHEAGVPSACHSPHDVHGFRLDIEQKPKWADGKVHDVTLYSVDATGDATPFSTFSVQFPSSVDDTPPPRAPGDIVGR